MYEHTNGILNVLSKKHNCTDLLYFECFPDMAETAKKNQLKAGKRAWKLELIQKNNPELKDLSLDWFNEARELLNESIQ